MLIGDLLARSESTVHYVGAGRRASTIKVRIGALRWFLEWLKTWYGLRSFTQPEHLLDYLREVVIEGRARGSVKRVKAALALAVHVACIRLASLQVRNTLFISMRTGILNSVRVGAPPSPAPRPLLILFWALGNFVCDFDGLGRRYGTTTISERIRAGWSSIPIAFVELRLLDELSPHGGAAHVRLVRCRVGRCLAQIRRAIDGGEPKIVEEDESWPDLAVRFRGAQPVAAAVAAPAPLATLVQNASEGILADMRFLFEEFAGLERGRTHMRDVLHDAFGLPCSSIQALTLHSRVFRVWEVINKWVAGRLLVASQYMAYGETLEMRQRDFLIYVEALNSAKGLVVVDERVPGRTLFDATIEQMEEGELYPDQLSDVITRADEDKQRRAQGEEQYLGLRPDLTIRRKAKRFTGTIPREREEVRDEYVLLANAWQMLYLWNPLRSMLRDFTLVIFSVALDFLFGEKVVGKTVKKSLGWVAVYRERQSLDSHPRHGALPR